MKTIDTILAMGIPSGPDLLVIAVLLLVLFGAKKLPSLARALPRVGAEFIRGKREMIAELNQFKQESADVIGDVKAIAKDVVSLPKVGADHNQYDRKG